MEKISGIYKIVNKISGRYYVGSSINILTSKGRFAEHIKDLNRGIHHNDYLQHAWNKYGQSNFDFIIVEKVSAEKLREVEQKYLTEAFTKSDCYNLNFNACSPTKLSEYSRNKISKKAKERGISDNCRKAIAEENHKRCGNNHPFSDKTIYTFNNLITKETFTGTRLELCKTYNIKPNNLCRLFKEPWRKWCNGWKPVT